MQGFPSKLRLLRERRGLSQKELAAELGFTNAHVSYLEAGKRNPTGEVVLKLSRFFGVPTDVLLKDELDLPSG